MRLFRRREPSRPAVPVPQMVDDWAFGDTSLMQVRDGVLRTGDWRPVAGLLAATTGADRRGLRADALAQAVVEDPAWADRWLAERPGDPDALLIRGWGEVHRAWDARGSGLSDTVTEVGWVEFFDRLDRAFDLCMEALREGPDDDPTPFVPLLWQGIGRQADHEEFRARFVALCAVDPLHRQGHVAALQYLSEKWHGSNHMMYEFARGVAADNPGTWATILPLQAHIEYAWAEVRAERDTTAFWESNPQLMADIDAAAAWAATGPDHALAFHDLSVLGYCLVVSERLHEAARLFERTGQRVFAYPWYYEPDPQAVLAEFAERTGQGWGVDAP